MCVSRTGGASMIVQDSSSRFGQADPVRRATQGSSRRRHARPAAAAPPAPSYQGRAIDLGRSRCAAAWCSAFREGSASLSKSTSRGRREIAAEYTSGRSSANSLCAPALGTRHTPSITGTESMSGMLTSVERCTSSAALQPSCSTQRQMPPTLRISKSGMSCCETAGSGRAHRAPRAQARPHALGARRGGGRRATPEISLRVGVARVLTHTRCARRAFTPRVVWRARDALQRAVRPRAIRPRQRLPRHRRQGERAPGRQRDRPLAIPRRVEQHRRGGQARRVHQRRLLRGRGAGHRLLDLCLHRAAAWSARSLPAQRLVQRWAHNENLALLPFGEALDDGGVALAASVGATPAELQAEPLDPLALDVVFDALCTSQSGLSTRTSPTASAPPSSRRAAPSTPPPSTRRSTTRARTSPSGTRCTRGSSGPWRSPSRSNSISTTSCSTRRPTSRPSCSGAGRRTASFLSAAGAGGLPPRDGRQGRRPGRGQHAGGRRDLDREDASEARARPSTTEP